jgi:hypothetical protein
VTADFAQKPGPHARCTEWLAADHTVERRAGKKTHNWYLALDSVVKESDRIKRVPGEGPCFHHELAGQLRDKLLKSTEPRASLVEVIPRDLEVEGEEAVLKVETWTRGGQDFWGARFKRSDGEWRLGSIEYDPDELGHG